MALLTLLVFSSREIQATCSEEYGVVCRMAPLYAAVDGDSECIGWLNTGSQVDVISFLSDYALIKT